MSQKWVHFYAKMPTTVFHWIMKDTFYVIFSLHVLYYTKIFDFSIMTFFFHKKNQRYCQNFTVQISLNSAQKKIACRLKLEYYLEIDNFVVYFIFKAIIYNNRWKPSYLQFHFCLGFIYALCPCSCPRGNKTYCQLGYYVPKILF